MATLASRFQTATPIERWALANAVGLLVATGSALWIGALWPLLVGGIGFLAILVVVMRDRWTPQGHFGSANGVTALRVGLLAGLPAAASQGPLWLLPLSLLILAADGLDGWLARRRTLTSEFGVFFDKEADSFFLLLLCGIAVFEGRLPAWILGAGLLRYGFVLVLFLVPSPKTTESRSTVGRYAYGLMVGALLTAFLPYPAVYRPLVLLATGVLLFSFAQSLWRIVPKRQALGES